MTENKDIEVAKQTIDREVEALKAMENELDGTLTTAVDVLQKTKGRVIVTGMGKSGHIGRKMAATFASTGTPSFFLHPGEASHGDLGMIEPDDIVIALSNSGEAPELSDIIAFCRRFGIKLIGMTGRRDSTLGRQSDVVLCLPPIHEACPFGLAPTTSTTLMMALGDALAIALLKLHNFSKEQYKLRHPGGKLGKMMLTVADLMHKGDEMPLVKPGLNMADALVEMSSKGFGCLGVVDDAGKFCGIFTDGDLRRAMAPNLLTKTVGDVMTRTPTTTTAQTLAIDALRIMNTTGKGITSLFVLDDDNRPIGLLHMHDCLRAGVA